MLRIAARPVLAQSSRAFLAPRLSATPAFVPLAQSFARHMATAVKIQTGDTIPEGKFKTVYWTPELEDHLVCGKLSEVSTNEWKGKKVVLFSVPGAFTPTCHVSHLPGYLKHYDDFKSKGVDIVAVLSANDAWVLSGWGRAEGVKDKIVTLSDVYAEWSAKLGLSIDLTGAGLGIRSSRYALIIDDLKVVAVEVEPKPGVTVSGAEHILSLL